MRTFPFTQILEDEADHAEHVIRLIEEGDTIRINQSVSYLMDITEELKNEFSHPSKIRTNKIREAFSKMPPEDFYLERIKNGSRLINFSEAYRQCVSGSLERAIALQVSLQNSPILEKSYLINGSIIGFNIQQRAYNIVLKDGDCFLLDMQEENPLRQGEIFVSTVKRVANNKLRTLEISPSLEGKIYNLRI